MAVAGSGWRRAGDKCQERGAIPEEHSGEGRILTALSALPRRLSIQPAEVPLGWFSEDAFLFVELLGCRVFPFEIFWGGGG